MNYDDHLKLHAKVKDEKQAEAQRQRQELETLHQENITRMGAIVREALIPELQDLADAIKKAGGQSVLVEKSSEKGKSGGKLEAVSKMGKFSLEIEADYRTGHFGIAKIDGRIITQPSYSMVAFEHATREKFHDIGISFLELLYPTK